MQARWPWSGSGQGTESFELERDATLRVSPGRRGVTLCAERGVVHITQAGDPDDHLIAAGEALWLPPGGAVVAWAYAPSLLVVAPERAARPVGLAAGAAA